MSSTIQNYEQEYYSGGDDDDDDEDGFHDDLEALRRACTLTGTNLDIDYTGNNSHSPPDADGNNNYKNYSDDQDEEDDEDFKLFQNVQNRFLATKDPLENVSLKHLWSYPPDLDNEEDDFETLRAVQRRFAAYDNSDILKTGPVNLLEKADSVNESSEIAPNDSLMSTRGSKVFPDTDDGVNTTSLISDSMEIHFPEPTEQDMGAISSWEPKGSSGFPDSGQFFIDAIKKNRSYQKFLRSKLAQIEARIEENKKLKERVKILRNFQFSCRKFTGKALAQGKDPRIQLIAARKDSKVNDKKVSAMHGGPLENSHVPNYRMALANFPLLLNRKKWTEVEKENLNKGIRQQFQERVLQCSVDQLSCSEGSHSNANNLDAILASIREMEISPENIREFLPKVDWDRLASLYVTNRTGAECEAQWLNCEDPLINNTEWTVQEDKKLLLIVQEKGMTNWFDIAVSLGTNRTPFQCLERFQRSLNARILKREWTEEEDAQLRTAVEIYGENDWQSVASTLTGRTGPQCSNRWRKSLRPNKMGRWTPEESKRLEVTVMLFGPKNWKKIARFVPGRADAQCRERWSNCMDPSLNMNKWTEEEDMKLKAAIEEHGYCWAKVAKDLPHRTDSQCLRRWKVLFPHEVPLLQAARRIKKAATIGNFVDRESERPALGPHDFLPSSMIGSVSEPEKIDQSKKHGRKTRGGAVSRKDNNKTKTNNTSKRRRPKRTEERIPISSAEQTGATNDVEVQKYEEIADVITHPESQREGNDLVDASHQSHVMTHHENSELGITDFEFFWTTEPREEKGIDKHWSWPDACTATTNSGEVCGMSSEAIIDVPVLADNHLDSNLSVITSDAEHDDAAGELDASSKLVTKHKKREIFMDSTQTILPPESSERASGNENANKSSFDGISLSRANERIEPLKDSQWSVLVPCQQNRQKKSKPKSRNGQKSEPKRKSSSHQVLDKKDDDDDDDDVTLASFLQNKLKKRRLQGVKNADQTCYQSGLMRKKQKTKGTISGTLPAYQNQETSEVDLVAVAESVGLNISTHEHRDTKSPPPGFDEPIYRNVVTGERGEMRSELR